MNTPGHHVSGTLRRGPGRSIGQKLFGHWSQTARLMLYGLLAVTLMAMDQQGRYVPRVRSAVEAVFEPIYLIVDWPVQVLRSAYGRLQSHRSLREDNETLRRELIRQQADLLRFETLTEENQRLRALIEGAAGKTFEYEFAELVSVDLDPFIHRVVIDRGSRHGVEPGQAIIDGAGVMGQVEEVRLFTSTVRLISDPSHALPVQINRTGLRTVAYGTGETGHLLLPNVPQQADVREGDQVVTSGLGDRFPTGYPVAEITLVERVEGETFLKVEAKPLAALDRGREVLMIRPGEVVSPATEMVAGEDAGEDNPASELEPASEPGPESAPAETGVDGSAQPGADADPVSSTGEPQP